MSSISSAAFCCSDNYCNWFTLWTLRNHDPGIFLSQIFAGMRSASIAGSEPKFLQRCHFGDLPVKSLCSISYKKIQEYIEKHCEIW